ncbi:MAG: glutamine amidotransferase [Gammaproteobacteria bacterium]
MTKTAVVIRHLVFEDLGSYADVLAAAGYRLRYLEAGVDDLDTLDPLAPDLLVILGGPIGVYQESDYPYLAAEIEIARRRIAVDRPTLGICLGAQIMARALGAEVVAGETAEIGWASLELTGEGRASPLRHLENVRVLHWHGDAFALPAGAERLAATPACPNQAFRLSANVLALQFHPEVRWPDLESWLIAHVRSLRAGGQSVTELRDASKRYASELVPAARRLLEEWIAGLEQA